MEQIKELNELKEMFLDNHLIKTAPYEYWYYHTEDYPNPVFLFNPDSIKNFNKSYGPTLSEFTYSSKEWIQIIKKEESLHKENKSQEALYINTLIKDYMDKCSINENKIQNQPLFDYFKEKAGSVRFSIISLRKSGVFDPRHILALGMEKIFRDTCYLMGIPFTEDPNIKDGCKKRIPIIQKEFDFSVPEVSKITEDISTICEEVPTSLTKEESLVTETIENENLVAESTQNPTNLNELEMSDISVSILECKNEKGLRYRLTSKKRKIKSTRYSLDILTSAMGCAVITEREEARSFVKNAIDANNLTIDNMGNAVVTALENKTTELVNNKKHKENKEILMTEDFKNTILTVYSLANEGKAIDDIIDNFNLDTNTICEAFRYSPITFEHIENPLDNDTIIEYLKAVKALELDNKGLDIQAIANALSITCETVNEYLSKKQEVFNFLHPNDFGVDCKKAEEVKEIIVTDEKSEDLIKEKTAVKPEKTVVFIEQQEDKKAEAIAFETNKDNQEALYQNDLNTQSATDSKGANVLLSKEPIPQASSCPSQTISPKEYQEMEQQFIVKKIKGNPLVLNSDGSPMTIDDIIFLKYATSKIIDFKKRELVIGRLAKRLYKEIDLNTNEGCYVLGSVVLKGLKLYEQNPKMQVLDIVAKTAEEFLQNSKNS